MGQVAESYDKGNATARISNTKKCTHVFKKCKVAITILDENVEPGKEHLFSSITFP
jgi:hypothetical protein